MSEQIRNGLTIPGGRYSGEGTCSRYHCVCVYGKLYFVSVCVCLLTATYQGYYEGLSQE